MTVPPDTEDTRECLSFIANFIDRQQWRQLIQDLRDGSRPSTRKSECAATLVASLAHGQGQGQRRQGPLHRHFDRQH